MRDMSMIWNPAVGPAGRFQCSERKTRIGEDRNGELGLCWLSEHDSRRSSSRIATDSCIWDSLSHVPSLWL